MLSHFLKQKIKASPTPLPPVPEAKTAVTGKNPPLILTLQQAREETPETFTTWPIYFFSQKKTFFLF